MSTGERTISLEVLGNTTISATVENVTDSLDFGRSYKWSIIAKKTGCDGNPLMVIEGSNNDIDWVNPYFDKATVLPVEIELTDSINTAFDDIFPYSFYRIRTKPNGNTTGTLSYILNLQYQ